MYIPDHITENFLKSLSYEELINICLHIAKDREIWLKEPDIIAELQQEIKHLELQIDFVNSDKD